MSCNPLADNRLNTKNALELKLERCLVVEGAPACLDLYSRSLKPLERLAMNVRPTETLQGNDGNSRLAPCLLSCASSPLRLELDDRPLFR
jgi:hypothetical protein